MRLNFYFIKTSLPLQELVSLLSRRSSPALALKPELAYLKKFVTFTHMASYKSFLSGAPRAEKLGMEWLARLACTPNLSSAREFCAPGKIVGIVSEKPFSEKELRELGKKTNYGPTQEHLHSFFNLRPLPGYSLEDLLIERSAVAFIG